MRPLRTLAQMRLNVRRLATDLRSEEFSNADIDAYLQEAAESVWNRLASDNIARRCLKKIATLTVSAGTADVSLPSDCLRIDRIEVVLPSNRFQALNYSESPNSSSSGIPVRWSDNADLPYAIRLDPIPANDISLRFVYYFIPAFPESDSDSFNASEGGSLPAAVPVPPGVDTAVEYLAVALLSYEELKDGTPIGAFGNLYKQKIGELAASLAGGAARPQRRYVRKV